MAGARPSDAGLMPGSLPGVLNIFSMRSVMRNPLTMLVIDANSAIAPRMRIRSG